MKQDRDPIFTLLAVDIYFLHFIGKKYFYCAKKLFEENDPENSLYPFCLLITTSLELFLKVIIATNFCIQMKNEKNESGNIKAIIIEKLKTYGHNIEKMINESDIRDKFIINKVEKISNDFVNDYRLCLNNGNTLCFKDSESIRFGSLAKKQDLAVSSFLHFNKEIVIFLEDLSEFSFSIMNKGINIFKNETQGNTLR